MRARPLRTTWRKAITLLSALALASCASTRAQAPSPSIDPDLAAVEDFLKDIRSTPEAGFDASSSKDAGVEPGIWIMPESWCVSRLALPRDEQLEECMVRELASGRGAVVMTVKNCEPEHCDVNYWIVTGPSGLRSVPISLEYPLVLSPDHKSLFTGYAGLDQDGYNASLVRIDLETLDHEFLAPCAGPTLAPSGRWLLCREISGNVHRLSLESGAYEAVHTIDLGDDVVYSDPHIGVSLHPVQFINDKRIRIFTVTADHKEEVEEVEWVD